MAAEPNKKQDETNASVAPFEENPDCSKETGLEKKEEVLSPSKDEENRNGREENERGEEENPLRNGASNKTKKEDRDSRQAKATKLTQGVIVGSSVILIVVGLVIIGKNYVKNGPAISDGLISLSGDNTVSFRFSLSNSDKMDLRLVASSNYGTSTIELPSPWKALEDSSTSCVYDSESPTVYTLEGALDNLRYDTTYTVSLVGNNKITDHSYSSAKVKTASFDESADVGFYWECHCLKDGYCSYQVIYPVTYTDWTAFRIDLTGKKGQKAFSLSIDSDLHAVHTFYSLSKDPGAYGASIYALDETKAEKLVKTADVAI